jgi:hypothetical protein
MGTTGRRTLLALVSVAALVAIVVGAALFQPWRLFTSSSIHDPLPSGTANIAAPSAAAPQSGANPPSRGNPPSEADPPSDPTPAVPTGPAAAGPSVLAAGPFQSQEHATSGTASLLMLPDGTHVVRLENLASSDGPDVKVWLSDLEAGGDWFKYRSGRYIDLGPIKATHGNQNYVVPPGADITGLGTVVLWCDRFSVSFGSAALR